MLGAGEANRDTRRRLLPWRRSHSLDTITLMERRRRMALGSTACLVGSGLILFGLGSHFALFWWLAGIAAFVAALVLFVSATRREA